MTQLKTYFSPRFVDFDYEPGTLVLGGMRMNMKILNLCVHTNNRVVHLSRLGMNSESHSASHLKMTQLKTYFSPRFVDFGYEPGTLALGGMLFDTANFRLVVPLLYKGRG
ncbi:MAG: hypothetical protein KAF91_30865 [Nostoc sp. TH1S01]|nr:hypothetical protein [Nostoc sp. TH1S01]